MSNYRPNRESIRMNLTCDHYDSELNRLIEIKKSEEKEERRKNQIHQDLLYDAILEGIKVE